MYIDNNVYVGVCFKELHTQAGIPNFMGLTGRGQIMGHTHAQCGGMQYHMGILEYI